MTELSVFAIVTKYKEDGFHLAVIDTWGSGVVADVWLSDEAAIQLAANIIKRVNER